MSISQIRQLIAQGWSDDEIQDYLSDIEIEAQEARNYDHWGDYDREPSDHDAMNDRLDMGRNEGGEWIGFM